MKMQSENFFQKKARKVTDFQCNNSISMQKNTSQYKNNTRSQLKSHAKKPLSSNQLFSLTQFKQISSNYIVALESVFASWTRANTIQEDKKYLPATCRGTQGTYTRLLKDVQTHSTSKSHQRLRKVQYSSQTIIKFKIEDKN